MTTDRHDPESQPELQDEFWGEHTEWAAPRRPSVEHVGFGATIGRWWNELLGGSASTERAHGRARVATPDAGAEPLGERRLDADDIRSDRVDDEAGDHDERAGDDAWVIEPEPQPVRHLGGDPLLARLGGLAVIITLAAPLVVGFVGSRSDSAAADSSLATIASAQLAAPSGATTVTAPENAAALSTDPSTSSSPSVAAASEAGSVATAAPAAAPSTAAPDSAAPALLESAPATESAAAAASESESTTATPCGASYELTAGDYWIRIADAADVPLADLLAVNDSSIDTVLVPGRSICLPVGASTPAPPTPVTTTPATVAPARSAPAAPSAPSPTPTTSAAPAPTTTTAPARPAAVPESQAAAIIRDVWPDDLEERALEIAWRESNHRSNVNNWCCYGLFQIHWEAHRSWLADLGVTSVSQLYDPAVNANAAYVLYQRAGGFGPWGG